MKNLLLVVVLAVFAVPFLSFAQSNQVLSSPTQGELEAVIGDMGLAMGQKLELRTILRALRDQGQKVMENSALSDAQKAAQVTKLRQGALSQTKGVLTAEQQRKLAAIMLPE